MKSTTTWVLVLSLCSFNAAYAMRCGHQLVDLGDYKDDVIARCGAPDSIETHTKIVGSTIHHPHRTLDLQEYEEIQIEEWVYNFGPSRFRQYLRFENGKLKEIKSLGRGY
ncbi:MAG: DUF2845 domain-containing protein [Methylobacter sp.]